MPTIKRAPGFFESEEGLAIEQALIGMVSDRVFNTTATYSANSDLYPNNKIPFVQKHLNYLRSHPTTDPTAYLANLRLMTRKR